MEMQTAVAILQKGFPACETPQPQRTRYLLPGTLAVSLVALAPFPVVYRRSAVDAAKE